MRRKNSSIGKRVLLVALFVAILGGISFGYAQLKETLTINGNAKIKSVKWNVNLKNLELGSNSNQVVDSNNTVKIHTGSNIAEQVVYTTSNSNAIATVTQTPNVSGGLELTFNVTLKEPGQEFKFAFDIVNDGTLDAVLKSIDEDSTHITTGSVTNSITRYVNDDDNDDTNDGTEPYFRYTISGAPAIDSTLLKDATKHVIVTIEYPELNDAQNLPTEDYTFTKTIKFNYEQK